MYRYTLAVFILGIFVSACGGGSDTTPSNSGNTGSTEVGSGNDVTDGENTGLSGGSVPEAPPNDTTNVPGNIAEGPVGGADVRYSYFASISVVSDDPVSMEAIFYEANQDLPLSESMELLFRPELDTCLVGFADINSTSAAPRPSSDIVTRSISAGEVLTVNSPAGSFTELLPMSSEEEIRYEMPSNVVLTPPIPGNLTLSVPGDEFPGFSNIVLPVIDRVDLLGPATGELITVDTEFKWVPSGDPDAVLVIFTLNPNVTASNLEDLRFTACYARDDGAFAFPDDTRIAMGDSFSGIATYSRATIKFVETANSFLLLQGVAIGIK